MVLDDQLCGIAGVGDLYTIGFDGVDVLCPHSFSNTNQRKEEQHSLHKSCFIFY
ncbi:hypothetical protein [Niastella populi]|uniref:hypothetical protein n=1 Tax=Niastella populi TaxID=550983 RepID=UPI001F61532D|nr:hypothetical protein [Niastella populi]